MNKEQTQNWIADNLEWSEYSEGYSEPGYSMDDEKSLIYFADWNSVDSEIIESIEEHFHIEWCDEWYQCQECNHSVRTKPDCWDWQPYYHIFNECEPICFDCIEKDQSLQAALLEDYVIKGNEIDPDKDSVNFRLLQLDSFNLENHGFKIFNVNHYENGFHPGQDDGPVKILKSLDSDFLESNHFIFKQFSSGQFSMSFDLYYKGKESK